MFYLKKKSILWLLLTLSLVAVVGLAACGELEFGVETKVSSGRPEVTVVTTTVAEVPEGMVLVTVTPSAQATTIDAATVTPTVAASETPTSTATTTPTPTSAATAAATAVQAVPTRQPVWPTNTPTFTPTPSWAQVLVSPVVSEIVWPGNSVTVDYEVRGNSAALCLAQPFTQDFTCYSVPTVGPYTVDIAASTRTNLQLEIRAFSDEGQAVGATALLLYCDEGAWFFSGPPTTCPASEPRQTAAAYQQFEHGLMLWLQEGLWWDSGSAIYILYDDQNQYFEAYPEASLPNPNAPTPNIEYDPPEGLLVPESGFGLLWREYTWIRQRLGWATAPEEGFTTTAQREFLQDADNLYLLDSENRLLVLQLYTGTWAERSQP